MKLSTGTTEARSGSPWRRRLVPALLVLAGLGAGAAWWALRATAPGKAAVRSGAAACVLPQTAPGSPHPGMVWVPAGRYQQGDTVYPEEQPLREVRVEGFWMGRTEVTNAEFAAFVQATGYVTRAEQPVPAGLHPEWPAEMRQPGAVVFVAPAKGQPAREPRDWWRWTVGANWRHPQGPANSIEGRDHWPVVGVTYEDAQAYALWRGHQLPSEAQWEWAARAGQPQAGQDHAQPRQANTWQGLFPMADSGEDGHTALAPVGCYAPNALGLYDLLGNAWELTRDIWRGDHSMDMAPDQVPPGMRSGQSMPQGMAQAVTQRVIKGGSFLCAPNYCQRYRSGARQPQDEDLATSHVGFRTVLQAPGP